MKQQPLNKQALFTALKTLIKTGQPLRKWQKQMKNSKQRYNILKQWQTTQRSYIQDLGIIQNDIQKPLRDAKLINDEQERLLFPNIKAMVELSSNLSKCVEDNIRTWNPNTTMIGENLIVFHKFFMIYREYCNNFMKAQEVVKTLKSNPNALKIQQKLKLDFESYTIKPVQRPPKYQLLLRQYHKCLHKNHKDYKLIQQAIQKYHQVNQLNNQSMDRQIRAEIMIKLDKKFGKIISSRTGREYLREFTCKCNQNKCIVYAFNDMLLVTQKKNEDTEVIYKRIYLDGTSFVEVKKNYKYYKNIVYVCGAVKSVHVQFQTPADTDHFQQEIGKTIRRLYRKEEERRIRFSQNEVRRRNLAKFRVSKWQDDIINKIIYKPKLEVNIVSSLKKKDEAFYAINYKIISPYNISQTILLPFKKLMQVQEFIKLKYKSSQLSKLIYIPESIGIIQASRNRTKIIEHRSLTIQEFLNHIFRNQDFYFIWRQLADQLGINSDLFDFSTTQNFTCNCDLCIEMKEDQPISYYSVLIKRLKEPHKTWIPQSKVEDQLAQQPLIGRSKSDIFQNSYVSKKKRNSQRCSCYVFNMYKCIREAQKGNIDCFATRMLSLQAEMGSINYTFLTPSNRPLKSQIAFKIYLLNVEQEYIEITLKEDKYVRQILEQIGINNSLSTIYDWNLYLYDDGQYHCIGNDEKLLDFLEKWGTSIDKIQQTEAQLSFFKDKIGQLKKIGEQFWGNSKGKLFLKKSLHFEHQIQVQACKMNKERYHFLINEIFGRIKNEGLYLTPDQLISMSAFYMMKNQFDRIKYWTEDNIDLNNLKQLLPAFHHPLIKTQRFRKQVFNDIKNHYKTLEQFQNSRNAIELIYLKILNYLRNNQQWITKYFFFSSHKGESSKDTIIGINYNYLIINKVQDRKNILTVQLQRLKYKTSTFSLFIYEGQSQYRYDGSDAWTVRQLIESYLTYTRLFRSK